MKRLDVLFVFLLVLCFTTTPVLANEFKHQIEAYFNNHIQGWLTDPVILKAIKAQNISHKSLTETDIVELDKQWRVQALSGHGKLVDQIQGKEISKFLKQKQDKSNGVISEIFVMDNKGLNVGLSSVTSDYMQGDEAKWLKTFASGKEVVFIDEVKYDQNGKAFQSQISATIMDPKSQKAIGAITVGLNVEKLM